MVPAAVLSQSRIKRWDLCVYIAPAALTSMLPLVCCRAMLLPFSLFSCLPLFLLAASLLSPFPSRRIFVSLSSPDPVRPIRRIFLFLVSPDPPFRPFPISRLFFHVFFQSVLSCLCLVSAVGFPVAPLVTYVLSVQLVLPSSPRLLHTPFSHWFHLASPPSFASSQFLQVVWRAVSACFEWTPECPGSQELSDGRPGSRLRPSSSPSPSRLSQSCQPQLPSACLPLPESCLSCPPQDSPGHT